jgi:hypothetical protein
MREAWAAEPWERLHQGKPLDELLLRLAEEDAAAASAAGLGSSQQQAAMARLEAAEAAAARLEALATATNDPADAAAAAAATAALLGVDSRSGRRSGSSSPGSSLDLCASPSTGSSLDGLGGAAILPIYPGGAASFAPICKDVPTLEAGRQEGFQSVLASVAPVLAAARRAGSRVGKAA